MNIIIYIYFETPIPKFLTRERNWMTRHLISSFDTIEGYYAYQSINQIHIIMSRHPKIEVK